MWLKARSSCPDRISMNLANPEFPPAFSGHIVMPGDDTMKRAAQGVRSGAFGAGDVVWSMETDSAVAAFVLEPEVPLATAMEMVPVLMVAIGDAIGSIAPPNIAFTYRWPDGLLANGAKVGEVYAAAESCASDAVPDWLVVGFSMRLTEAAVNGDEPGRQPDRTALHLEGAGDIDRTMMIEAVARHFLSWIDGWLQDGFKPVHPIWIGRRQEPAARLRLADGNSVVEGEFAGLDEHGGVLLKTAGAVKGVSLIDAMLVSHRKELSVESR